MCVLAFAMAGTTHAHAGAYNMMAPATSDLTAYVFPDGSVASLCLPGDDDSTPGKKAGCDICCLATPVFVPVIAHQHGLTVHFAAVIKVHERQYRITRALYPPSSGPRAPPHALKLA